MYHGQISLFHSFPAVVAIHDVVTARNAGNTADADFFGMRNQFANVMNTAGRRGIAAISEGVQKNFMQTAIFGKFENSGDVVDVAVNTTVRDQTLKMQCLAGGFNTVDNFYHGFVFKERTVFNRAVDAGDILINDPAGTDIEVPDL